MYLCAAVGRWDEALDWAARLLPLAEKLGGIVAQQMIPNEAAQSHWALSADPEVFRRCAITDEEFERTEGWLRYRMRERVAAKVWGGDWEGAAEDARRLRECPPGETVWRGFELGFESYVLALAGQLEESRVRLAETASLLPRGSGRHDGGSLELAVWSTLAHALNADVGAAARPYPALLQMRDQGVIVLNTAFGLLETVLGVSATGAGDWDAALEHFDTAIRQAEELPLLSERAEARRWKAWSLLQRGGDGDREAARELLERAVALHREMGLDRHARWTEEMLGQV